MKMLYLILFFSCTATFAQVQKMNKAKVGGTTAINASAALEVESTTQGFLIPRMTTAQRVAIATPAAGLQVYDTNLNTVWLYNGTAWVRAGSKFVDGTDPLNAVYNQGNVGIGTLTPSQKLHLTNGNLLINESPNPMIRLHSNANIVNEGGAIEFTESSPNYGLRLKHSTGSDATKAEGLYFESNFNNTFSSIAVIDQNNNRVGIGTSIPTERLSIGALDAPVAMNISNSLGGLRIGVASVPSNYGLPQAGDVMMSNHTKGIAFATNNSTAMYISDNSSIGIGTGANNPVSSAQLQVNSTTRGFLPPRMTSAQMLAISVPEEGLLVYCTNCTSKGLYVFDGIYWTNLIGSRSTLPVSNVLFQWDFESTTPFNNLAANQQGITVVTDPVNPNNKVMKIELLKGGDRKEAGMYTTNGFLYFYYADAPIGFKDAAGSQSDSRSLGSEVWLSMKIFKPQEQNTNSIKPSIFQFGPVNNWTTQSSSSAGYYQLRIRNDFSNYKDRWNSRLWGGTNFTPWSANHDDNFVVKPYGNWEHFVFHFKFKSTSDGIVEVWKDGVKYINKVGPNANPFNQTRIVFGLYLGTGNSAAQDLTCYYDDIRIGGANCTYEEITK